MKYKIVIPARFASSRLPGKPLATICGKPMVWHVYQRALGTGIEPEGILVATDDVRIFKAVKAFNGNAVMTSPDHDSGTERLAEVARLQGWCDDDIVVNLQGDEPLIQPELLALVAELVAEREDTGLATLATPVHSVDDFLNPNIVKVVLDNSGHALYFSRAPMPWPRDAFANGPVQLPEGDFYRHLGMYAYRVGVLKSIPQMPTSALEQLESLEQLRPLQQGVKIRVGVIAEAPAHGVDTEQDLARVDAILREQDAVTQP